MGTFFSVIEALMIGSSNNRQMIVTDTNLNPAKILFNFWLCSPNLWSLKYMAKANRNPAAKQNRTNQLGYWNTIFTEKLFISWTIKNNRLRSAKFKSHQILPIIFIFDFVVLIYNFSQLWFFIFFCFDFFTEFRIINKVFCQLAVKFFINYFDHHITAL